jgi:hypothetical protein
MLKRAIRFKGIHRESFDQARDRRLGPATVPRPRRDAINEHTLSAGEIVAAFTKENAAARPVESEPGSGIWRRLCPLGTDSSSDYRREAGTPGAVPLWKGESVVATHMLGCRSRLRLPVAMHEV